MTEIRWISKLISTFYRTLRREYLIHFRPNYVKRQLEIRRGKCDKCPGRFDKNKNCCFLAITKNSRLGKCLKNDGVTCFKWSELPHECYLYPIDEKDKIPETRYYCEFHWPKKE